jgi:SAM-dependent methyltransferase
MSFRKLAAHWNRFGEQDPFRAILTGRDLTPEEFFATGVADAARILEHLGGRPAARGHALDFGCGVGRLSCAMASHFKRVIGVDVAPSMLAHARARAHPGCEFVLNAAPDLAQFSGASFDLVFSRITLQHCPPASIRAYLDEFARLVRPGGAVHFQLPAAPLRPSRAARAAEWLYNNIFFDLFRRNEARMEMHGLDPAEVVRRLERAGLRPIRVSEDWDAVPGWTSFCYSFEKPDSPPAHARNMR